MDRKRVHFEFRHRRADGSIREVEVFTSRIENQGKDLLHSIVHDITDRKLAEAQRDRLTAAFNQVGESIMITDPNGTIQYVNPAFESVTGYSSQEVIGQNSRILKSGKHGLAFYQNLWATITSGQTWTGSIINQRQDGALYTVLHRVKRNLANYVFGHWQK